MGTADGMFTGDVWRAIQELDRKLQNLTSGRRLEDASIGARGIRLLHGGSLTINGGAIRMTDETGSIGLVYIGTVSIGSEQSRGWIFRFDTGGIAFQLAGSPGSQFWGLRDQAGNLVVSNDAASGAGLGKPYLNIPMYPSSAAQHQTGGPFWPATNSTSFVELMHGFTTVWHPRLKFGMDTSASGGVTEWRLLISGTLIASGSGDVAGTYSIPDWGTSINPGDEKVIQVEVRNTTGSVSWCQVDKCYGTQS